MSEIIVAIPCYNECENIPRLVPEVLAADERIGVIVIDDNSPDGTGAAADRLAARNPRVQVIHRPGKLGLGTAYRDAMKAAAATECRLFITMDADFSHSPRYLPEMIAKAADYGVVIGSRYVPGGGVRNWNLKRRMFSRTGGLAARILLGLMRVKDTTGGFRCYSMRVIRQFGPDAIISRGFSFQSEMLCRFKRAGASMLEIPIIFENRRVGKSKINFGEAWGLLKTLVRLRLGA